MSRAFSVAFPHETAAHTRTHTWPGTQAASKAYAAFSDPSWDTVVLNAGHPFAFPKVTA